MLHWHIYVSLSLNELKPAIMGDKCEIQYCRLEKLILVGVKSSIVISKIQYYDIIDEGSVFNRGEHE